MMVLPKLTLTYFSFQGRAEMLRLALVIGKVPFSHRAIVFQNWGAIKPTLPLGQLPLLEIEEPGKDKLVLVQSLAILRYIGKLGGLYPSDPVEAAKVDAMVDTISECTLPIEMSVQGGVKWLVDDEKWSKKKVMEVRQRIVSNEKHGLPFYMKYFDDTISKNGSGWLVGDNVTIADLRLYNLLFWIRQGILDGIPADTVDDYPAVKSLFENIEALPAVVSWRAEHPTPYNDFEYTAESG